MTSFTGVSLTNTFFSYRFCFLRCALKGDPASTTKQLLIFPPIVKKCLKTFKQRLNINIVVQDAISRHYFYRALPKTVTALREIVHDPSIDATVLDFEKYQSYDASTHSNIKRLFAGKNTNTNKSTVSDAMKEMYKKFKEVSYETLFQEDICWSEGFASLFRPSFLKVAAQNDTSSFWKGFYKYLKENFMPVVDSFGVGFSSCKLLQDLGDKNIFNGETLPLLCLDGRPFSHYYFKVVHNFLETNSFPMFSYLHLNTGHEHTGQRITQDDEYLADFVKTMAAEHERTLTILLSDHGGKTTKYATRTVYGLKEIYRPFMFIIVPRQAAKILGNERMENLIRNQKQLVSLEDLSFALQDIVKMFGGDRGNAKTKDVDTRNFGKSIGKKKKDTRTFTTVRNSVDEQRNARNFEDSVRGNTTRGLFDYIPANRNCSQLGLSAEAVCLCEGEEVEAVMDPLFLEFLASIAVGSLNDKVQFQYNGDIRKKILYDDLALLKYPDKEMNGKNGIFKLLGGDKLFGGYGNCLRYVPKRVERQRSKVINDERMTTFNVVVKTIPVVHNREEIFEMTVGHHVTNTNDVRLLKVTRLSRYSVFKPCADTNVQLDLCTCDVNSHPDPKKYIRELLGYYIFSQHSNIEKLEYPCLHLVTNRRRRFLKSGNGQDGFLAYEVMNACERIFNITILDSSLVRQPLILSRPLPFSLTVYPYAAHHVISAFCGLPDGEFFASFKVEVLHTLI